MASKLEFRTEGSVGRIRMDDGAANTWDHTCVRDLGAALDRAEAEMVGALLLEGRAGVFSAGVDLKLLKEIDAIARRRFMREYLQVVLRLFQFPRPVVAAVTGHAIGGGALIALATDVRLGTRGRFQLGFREVAMGIALPAIALEIARLSLTPEALTRCLVFGELVDPEAALRLGFVSQLCSPEDVVARALEEANRLALLPAPTFGITKRSLHDLAVRSGVIGEERDVNAFSSAFPYEPSSEQSIPVLERREREAVLPIGDERRTP